MLVIVTQCSDLGIHRSRIETRQRLIPNWYELDWERVKRSRAGWEPPQHVDLLLEATDPWEDNVNRLRDLFP
jgi:hypothetical protein